MTPQSREIATGWLVNAGLRPTRQRVALAELLVGDGRHRHVTAESLLNRQRRTGMRCLWQRSTTLCALFAMRVCCKKSQWTDRKAISTRTRMIIPTFLGRRRKAKRCAVGSAGHSASTRGAGRCRNRVCRCRHSLAQEVTDLKRLSARPPKHVRPFL